MRNPITKLLTAAALLGAPTVAMATPRTLPSGAPACGNTMGKGGYRERACTATELEHWEASRNPDLASDLAAADATQRVAAHSRAHASAKPQAGRTRTVAAIARLTLAPVPRLRG